MIGPFIFMEIGGPTEVPRHLARGVPEQPHAGLSTFTHLMDGAIRHRDSAGDIVLMTSGQGISQEELSVGPTSHKSEPVHFVQMWLALPDELEEMTPAFELHRAADLPELPVDRPLEGKTVKGVLRAVHLDNDWLEVTVGDTHVRVERVGEAVDDGIGPMVRS